MGEIFADIFGWVASLSPIWTYLVILAISYGENVLPPIPGDMIIVFGGYLASVSSINFFAVWLLATIGGALGFMSMYAIGYYMGDAVVDPNRWKWLPKKRIQKVRVWLQNWGYWVVITNRFLSGARSVISLSVGMAHMNASRTAIASTVSALVWTGLIGYAGYAIGENWAVVSDYLRAYGWFILGGTVAVAGFFYVRSLRRKSAASSGSVEASQVVDEQVDA